MSKTTLRDILNINNKIVIEEIAQSNGQTYRFNVKRLLEELDRLIAEYEGQKVDSNSCESQDFRQEYKKSSGMCASCRKLFESKDDFNQHILGQQNG
jgi:hypothetical protein